MTDAAADRVADERDQFLPVRKADLLDALVEHGQLAGEDERAKFRQIARILGAIYHYEYFDRLDRLRQDYFYFDPELDPHARFDPAARASAYADLVESLTAVLRDANFVEISHADIQQAHRMRKAMRVNVTASLDDFRDVRLFHRGHHREAIEIRQRLGLRKTKHEVTVYDDVVLFVATKPAVEIISRGERKLLVKRKIRPGSVLIKYFRNIPSTDLNGLFPNVRVVMSMMDTLALGLPALAGAIPILLNLASTVTVLFLVIGFYLGIVAAVEHDELKRGFAAMSGLVALIGFVTRQWLRYQRQSLKYQKELTDNVYYRNINNNAGIFDYVIASAEDQECKEAFLAYYFLATGAATQDELERRIESWLRESFAVDVDFNIGEALAKLQRFGLIEHSGERFAVPSPDETLGRLLRVWRDFFAEKTSSTAIAGGAPA